MTRLLLQAIFAIGVLAAQPLVAQRRARAALPLDFAAAVAASRQAFDVADYATVLRELARAASAARSKQRGLVYAAMPEVAGFVKQPRHPEPTDYIERDGLLGYRQPMGCYQAYLSEDKRLFSISVGVGPPTSQLSHELLVANANVQEVLLDGYKATVTTRFGRCFSIVVVVDNGARIVCESQTMTLDALLAVMRQENVDRLAAATLPKDR